MEMTNYNSDSKDILSNILKTVLILVFLFLYGLLLFGENVLTAKFIIPNYILFICAVLFIVLISKYIPIQHNTTIKRYRENVLIFLISLAILGLQFFITYNIIFRTSWDVAAVWYGSHWVSMNDIDGILKMSEYYSIYPNNLLLVFIFSRILKLNLLLGNHISNGGLLLALIQCIMINLSGIILFKCAKHYVSIRLSWVAYSLYTLLISLSGWMVLPYSDGMGVIFPILLLYLYIRCRECAIHWKKYMYIFFLFLIGIIAYHIKPYTAIILIAIVVIELINFIKTVFQHNMNISHVRQSIFAVILAVITLFLGSFFISYANNSMGFEINPEQEMGIPHYLMMGANVNSWGGYSDEDLAFGSDLDNKKLRNQAEMKEFFSRLSDMGLTGYLKLFTHKAAKNFLDGTYSWRSADSFYTEIYPSRGTISDLLRSWYYGFGSLYRYNAVIRQFLWIMVLFLVPFSAFCKRAFSTQEKVLVLSILGLMLYLQIFESQARYVFTFIPLYTILAGMGIKNIRYFLVKKQQTDKI